MFSEVGNAMDFTEQPAGRDEDGWSGAFTAGSNFRGAQAVVVTPHWESTS